MDASRHDTTLWQDLRALPSQYWILFGGTLINRFGNFVMPFMTLYLRHEREAGHGDYSEAKIGIVLGAYGAGSMLAGLVGGHLTDKLGRKPVVMLSCFGSSVFMLLLSQAHGMAALTSCIFIMAVLTALYNPAVGALIADLVPPELRTRAYSCQRWAVNTGFAAGMAAAGFMVRFGFAPLFIGDALTTLIMGFVAWFGLKNVVVPKSERQGWLPAVSHMRGNRPFLLAVAASFLIALTFTQIGSCFSLQATKQAGLDEHAYGYLLSLNGLLVVLFELPLTSVTRRFSPSRIMAAGYAVVGVGLGINMLGASVPLLVSSMVVLTLGEICSFPISNSYLAALSPDDMRGRYQGVMSMTWSAATLFGPAAGLAIYERSPVVLWLITLLLAWVSALLMLATRVEGVKRTE
ncbi:MFS transporter [Luteolibacter ambystomatis]|uniref:MFS transporter n=1 Tax=Luteolibacter ambystomatis TaxID=2824561 RepID=A0A975G7Z9_9BACT|nr:MFS transporter [Luteolibacter ambystomatis]QUE50441.1 MFS transporter [Luteolibacter ambystomatis]